MHEIRPLGPLQVQAWHCDTSPFLWTVYSKGTYCTACFKGSLKNSSSNVDYSKDNKQETKYNAYGQQVRRAFSELSSSYQGPKEVRRGNTAQV